MPAPRAKIGGKQRLFHDSPTPSSHNPGEALIHPQYHQSTQPTLSPLRLQFPLFPQFPPLLHSLQSFPEQGSTSRQRKRQRKTYPPSNCNWQCITGHPQPLAHQRSPPPTHPPARWNIPICQRKTHRSGWHRKGKHQRGGQGSPSRLLKNCLKFWRTTGKLPTYSGIFPCFLLGRCSTFVRCISSAAISLGRVSLGSIISSIYPRSAARYGCI